MSHRRALLALAVASFPAYASAADIFRNTTVPANLNTAAAWEGNVLPGTADYATWDNRVPASEAASENISGNYVFGGFKILDPQGPVVINIAAGQTASISAPGIDMTAATQDLTFNAGSSTSVFRLSPNSATTHAFNVAANRTLTINSQITVQGGTHTLNLNPTAGSTGTIIFNGSINSGTAGLNVTQTGGTVTLAAANSFTGSGTNGNYVLNGGTLNVDNDAALNANSRFDLASATLKTDLAAGVNILQPNVRIVGSPTIAGSNSISLAGTITNTNANRTITNSLDPAATFTLNNVNLSGDASNRILTLTGTGTTVINGVIANGSTSTAANLTKTGTGTLVIGNAAHTYAGTTTVGGGTLLINATLPGPVNVTTGNLSIGTLSSDLGTLTTPSLTLAGTTALDIDAGGADAVNASALVYGGALTLNVSSPLADAALVKLFTSAAPTGDFASITLTGAYSGALTDAAGAWSGTFGNTTLTFTDATGSLTAAPAVALPEPSAALLLPLAALPLARRRR